MAKILIINKADLSIASQYEAEASMQGQYGGPWGRPEETAHVVLAEGMDKRWADIVQDEAGTISAVENAVNKAAAQLADAKAAVHGAVSRAIGFGQAVLTDFATDNVLLGITQDGKTGEVLTKMAGVMQALQSGSLYEAIARAKAIPEEDKDVKYITDARLLEFVNKIEAHLGIPASEEL